MKKKIIDIKQLSKKVIFFKKRNIKIVLCHGVFDLVHAGHIMHFSEAKSLGDILVVSVTPDKFVNKGPNRPVFKLKQRMQTISQINSVDYVENYSEDSTSIIKIIKPDIYCKGKDYKNHVNDITGKILDEKKSIESIGGKIHYTESKLFSSSKIINDLSINLNSDQNNFLKKIKSKSALSSRKIENKINQFKDLNILVVGETIIDKYVYCEALGKSGKEPMLVLRDLKTQKYAGGTLAIARNLSSFCRKVTILSYIGNKKNELKFVKNNLPKNVNFKHITKKNSPTILKTRFVEHINSTKLFGIHSLNDQQLAKNEEKLFLNLLKKEIHKSDIVLVSDYGHGLITEKICNFLMNNSKFLSVNAQLNAANIGFHTISKYKKSNLIIINENELRHETRDKETSLNTLLIKLSKKLKTDYLVVTSGSDGAKIFDNKRKKILNCPAFTLVAKDKVGAGDTLLSLLSLCICKKFNLDLSMLIASLGAAENVKSMASSKSISDRQIIKFLQAYLK